LHRKIIVETASRYSLEFRKKGSGPKAGNGLSWEHRDEGAAEKAELPAID